MRKSKRLVRAHRDRNGMVVYNLLQGDKKPRTVRRYGYGMYHKIWVQIQPYGTNGVAWTVEPAVEVKEQIAQWCK